MNVEPPTTQKTLYCPRCDQFIRPTRSRNVGKYRVITTTDLIILKCVSCGLRLTFVLGRFNDGDYCKEGVGNGKHTHPT